MVDVLTYELSSFDSMMTHFADPRNTPEMLKLREQIRSWRFYDHFRTDVDAPARFPQIGTHTPVLSHDGSDLAAALQTIREIGDVQPWTTRLRMRFPAAFEVSFGSGWFEIEMHQHGLFRPLKAAELSDGTLRYLLWIAALLTPRPPGLLVLNEPETSLHPDLFPPWDGSSRKRRNVPRRWSSRTRRRLSMRSSHCRNATRSRSRRRWDKRRWLAPIRSAHHGHGPRDEGPRPYRERSERPLPASEASRPASRGRYRVGEASAAHRRQRSRAASGQFGYSKAKPARGAGAARRGGSSAPSSVSVRRKNAPISSIHSVRRQADRAAPGLAEHAHELRVRQRLRRGEIDRRRRPPRARSASAPRG